MVCPFHLHKSLIKVYSDQELTLSLLVLVLVRERGGLTHPGRTGPSVLRPPVALPGLSPPVARTGGRRGRQGVAGLRQRRRTQRPGLKHRGTTWWPPSLRPSFTSQIELMTGTHSLAATESGWRPFGPGRSLRSSGNHFSRVGPVVMFGPFWGRKIKSWKQRHTKENGSKYNKDWSA